MKHLLILLILLTPTIAFGQDTGFVPLVGIPYVDTQDQATTLGDYVNGLYWASISIAAVLAFLKITWAGIKYMMSEIVTDKQSAKSDIKGALLGLIIILAAVLILDTINPEIKKLTALNLVPLKGDVTVVEPEIPPSCNVTSGCNEVPVCETGETLTISIGDTGDIVYGCIPIEDTDEEPLPDPDELPDGSLTQEIAYMCDPVPNPNGCLFPDSFLKAPAEATCTNLSSTGDAILYDDPARLGWGICYYNP